MPHNVSSTSPSVRTVSTCEAQPGQIKPATCTTYTAAATHHIQLALEERRELYLTGELRYEDNLRIGHNQMDWAWL